jgi:uncharacterized protein YcfL
MKKVLFASFLALAAVSCRNTAEEVAVEETVVDSTTVEAPVVAEEVVAEEVSTETAE